jgi:hypothetical protein
MLPKVNELIFIYEVIIIGDFNFFMDLMFQ